MSEPLRIGSKVKLAGKTYRVAAIGLLEGERYYWLKSWLWVAMFPACVVEKP